MPEQKSLAITLENVHKSYFPGRTEVKALRGVNLTVAMGEFLVILGPSGCGKTTLLSLLGALDTPTRGEITVQNERMSALHPDELARYRRTNIGMVFQQFNLLPGVSTLENVAMPLLLSGIPRREAVKRSRDLLRTVHLLDRAAHKPTELSGGEQQRVAIARALAVNPWILLVDEPTGNLDEDAGSEIMQLLKEIHSWGRTIVLVTHNQEYASYGTRIITMKNGRVNDEQKVLSNEQKTELDRPLAYYIASIRRSSGMNFFETVRFAARNFCSKKLRTFLTTLGVSLGVASIVTLVSIGIGLQEITTKQLANFNALVTITVGISKDSTKQLDDTVKTQLAALPNVSLVSPSITTPVNITLGESSTQAILTGIEPDATDFEGIRATDGTAKIQENTVVLSRATAKNFNTSNPASLVGKTITISLASSTPANAANLTEILSSTQTDYEATIVGITSDESISTAYVPLQDLRSLNASTPYSTIKVRAASRDKVAELRKAIESQGYTTNSVVDLIEKIDSVFHIAQIVLAVIGSISLIVALLGIVNIMTISLLERTHEIGILKAIGASNKNIKMIFQYEVLFFGIAGGLSGIFGAWLFGYGVNKLVSYLMEIANAGDAPQIFITPLYFALEMLIITIIVSLIGGQYPSRLAAKLSPAEALRYQ